MKLQASGFADLVDHAVPLGIIRLEPQRDRVHAVALSGRLGTIIEEMAEVTAAPGARDLDAAHAEAHILVKLDGSPSDRLKEAGPAGARVVLRLGTEQFRSARRAPVGPAILRERVLAGEGALRALVPEHLELFRGQALSPLLLGARELLLGPLSAHDLLVHDASLGADLTPGSEERCSSDPLAL